MGSVESPPHKYTEFDDYYEPTKDRDPSPFLIEAVGQLGASQTAALDFGCGSGSETRYLLGHGLDVTAVDGNPATQQYITNLPHGERATFICSDFETFSFGSYDLINSSFSLPFINKPQFEEVMYKLLGSLRPQGIFVGNFFGIRDEWNTPDEARRTFLDRKDIEMLFTNLEIMKLKEVEGETKLARGGSKHAHYFSFLVHNK